MTDQSGGVAPAAPVVAPGAVRPGRRRRAGHRGRSPRPASSAPTGRTCTTGRWPCSWCSRPWSTGWSPGGSWTGPRCVSRPACCAATPGSCRWPGSRRWTWCGRSWPVRSAWPSCASGWPGPATPTAGSPTFPSRPRSTCGRGCWPRITGWTRPPRSRGERILASVPNGRLVGSVAASPASLLAALLVAEVVAIAGVADGVRRRREHVRGVPDHAARRWCGGGSPPSTASPSRSRRMASGSAAGCSARWRRPSRCAGCRRCGWSSRVLWRPLGWCRLEIDVAGSPGRDHADGSGRMRKTLLPVGHREPAWELMRLVIGAGPPPLSRPPRRARRKAPLSYHFLAAGHDAATAMGVTGRRPQGHHLGAAGEGAERPDGHRPGAAGPVPGHRARGRGRAAGPGRVPGPARGRGRASSSRSWPR